MTYDEAMQIWNKMVNATPADYICERALVEEITAQTHDEFIANTTGTAWIANEVDALISCGYDVFAAMGMDEVAINQFRVAANLVLTAEAEN